MLGFNNTTIRQLRRKKMIQKARFLYSNTRSVEFDGADDYVNLADVTETNSASAFTIQMWVKPDDTQPNRWAGRRKDGNNRISFAFLSGKITAALATSGNANGSVTQALDISAWHFLTMVFDGSGAANADRLKVYLGTTEKTLSFSGTIPSATYNFGASYPFRIGDDGASNYFLNGNVAQFYLYSSALSASDVADNYNGTKATYGL